MTNTDNISDLIVILSVLIASITKFNEYAYGVFLTVAIIYILIKIYRLLMNKNKKKPQ